MTTPTTPGPPRQQSTAADLVFRRALRDMLVLLGILTVVGVLVGYLVDGMAGVWGALIGVFVALIFSGTTVISVWRTSGSNLAHWTAHLPVLPPTSSNRFGRSANTSGRAAGNAMSE